MNLSQLPKGQRSNKLENYIGWKLGDMYVTPLWRRDAGGLKWGMQCTCGSPVVYRKPTDIINILYKSCSTCSASKQDKTGHKNSNYKGTEDIPQLVYCKLVHNTKNRNKDIKLVVSIDDLQRQWSKQAGICTYTGLKLTMSVDASLDRIDSALDYTEDNIHFIHKDINRMKSDFSEERFLMLCGLVAEG